MSTKKEILKRKDRWIKALQATIDKYQYCIDNNELYPIDGEDCALCRLDDLISDETKLYYICDNCIHLSSFGHGDKCYNQRSFKIIQDADGSVDMNVAFNSRKEYLQTILDKLK